MEQRGLGFVPSRDERDYKMATILRGEGTLPESKIWRIPRLRLDQGMKPACVGFSMMNLLRAGPVFNKARPMRELGIRPVEIWGMAQEIDPEMGQRDPHQGTHTRYAGQWLREKGVIESYYMAEGGGGLYTNPTTDAQHAHNARAIEKAKDAVAQIIECVLTQGPVVIGIPWYRNFNRPVKGFLERKVGEYSIGGHALMLFGWDATGDREFGWLENSWGELWGIKPPNDDAEDRGCAKIDRQTLEELFVYSSDGIIAVEQKPGG